MPLTATQKQMIARIDNQAKQILRLGGSEEALLMSFSHQMEEIKKIIEAASENELNVYCDLYDGFYRCMELLERLALGASRGTFDDLLK